MPALVMVVLLVISRNKCNKCTECVLCGWLQSTVGLWSSLVFTCNSFHLMTNFKLGKLKSFPFMFCQTADPASLAVPVVAGCNFPLFVDWESFYVFKFSLSWVVCSSAHSPDVHQAARPQPTVERRKVRSLCFRNTRYSLALPTLLWPPLSPHLL